jgi:hypothetical protein
MLDEERLLARAAGRAVGDRYFLGWTLWAWCRLHGADAGALAELWHRLGIRSEQQFVCLALSRAPMPGSASYAADIARIADRCAGSAPALVDIYEEVSVWQSIDEP